MNILKDNSNEEMDMRTKLRIMVNFMKLLGVDFDYYYSRHLLGPYSMELT